MMGVGQGLAFRLAHLEDAPAMARVFVEAIAVKARDSYGPRERAAWTARGTAQRFTAMLAESDHALYVAELDREVVAVGGRRGGEVSLLYAGSAAPAGTGARLLSLLEEDAGRLGLTGLSLCASRNALAFYLRRGYAVVRLAGRPLPGGVVLPVCLMAKVLGPASPGAEVEPGVR